MMATLKKTPLIKRLCLQNLPFAFFIAQGNIIAAFAKVFIRPFFFHDQSSARLQLTDKGTVKPSEIFSLLGLDAQNLTDSPLEQLGLNPEF